MTDDSTPTRELVGLTITGSAGVARGANEPQIGGGGWLVIKAAESSPNEEKPMTATATVEKADVEMVQVSKADYDALVAKAKKMVDDEQMDDENDLDIKLKKALDSMPEEVRKQWDQMAADTAAAKTAAATAEAVAKGERDARLAAEFVAKADAEYSGLPVTPAEFGPVLRSISELLPAEHAATLTRVLAAASNAAGLVAKSHGLNTGVTAGSAADRIEKAAAALIAADSSLTRAVAVDRVLATQPALAADYMQER